MIIAVAGGKGGVGKTTVSLNLGPELDAVVVDGDLTTADLPHERGPGIHDVLAGRTEPTDAVQRFGSVRVLSCGPKLEGARASDLDRFEDVVRRIERTYGTVIIDCPAGLARDVGEYLDAADVVVLVTTPNQIAIADAARTKELAIELGTPISCVAVNLIEQRSETPEERQEEVESALNVESVSIPFATEVTASQEQGQPVSDFDPDSDAVDHFAALASVINRGRHKKDAA